MPDITIKTTSVTTKVRDPYELKFADDSYRHSFMRNLLCLKEEATYTDVTLQLGEEQVPCHKIVLVAASDYFRAMFSSNLLECESETIPIEGVSPETVKNIIKYLYSSKININHENVQSLVEASDMFQLQSLKDACEKFMIQNVEPSNCIGLHKFAKLYQLKRLQSETRTIMCKCFREVCKVSTEFTELCTTDLIEYITDNDIAVKNEDPVFEAVVAWVNHDLEKRKPSFDEIFSHLRLPFCTSAYLCHIVQRHSLVTSPDAMAVLDEARMYHMLPDHRQQLVSSRMVPRSSFPDHLKLILLGGLTREDKENRYCWYFRESTSTWELLAQLPRPALKFLSAVSTQKGIILTGGYNINVKKESWLFDSIDKTWKVLPTLIDARCKHQMVVHGDGNIYVIGGEDDHDKLLDQVECLDSRTYHRWKPCTPMRKPLSDPLIASHGSKIYVMGGIEDGDKTSTTTQIYDSVTGTWAEGAEMPHPCRLGGVVVVNNMIYVVGGYTRSCMKYNPFTDSWTELSAPRGKHGNAPAVVWKGRIVVGGGDVDNDVTSMMEEYDVTTDSWSYGSISLKEELSCHYMLNVDMFGI